MGSAVGGRLRRGNGRLLERAAVRLRIRRHLGHQGQQGLAPSHAALQPLLQRLLGNAHDKGNIIYFFSFRLPPTLHQHVSFSRPVTRNSSPANDVPIHWQSPRFQVN